MRNFISVNKQLMEMPQNNIYYLGAGEILKNLFHETVEKDVVC